MSEERQAEYYVQVLEGVDAFGRLDKVFFYEIVDDPRSPEQCGILRSDLTPKQAFYSYQGYIAAHADRSQSTGALGAPATAWSSPRR